MSRSNEPGMLFELVDIENPINVEQPTLGKRKISEETRIKRKNARTGNQVGGRHRIREEGEARHLSDEQKERKRVQRNASNAINRQINAAAVARTAIFYDEAPRRKVNTTEVDDRPTPEKVGFIRDVYGASDGISTMSKNHLNVTYVITKVFEKMHCQKNRRKSSTLKKHFIQFMTEQLSTLCGGEGILEIEKEVHRKMRQTMWHPARISHLQDSLLGCSLNMTAIDALNVLTRKFKLDGVLNIIPSRANVQRWNRAFERGVKALIKSRMNRKGNVAILEVEDFLIAMLCVSEHLRQRGRTDEQIKSGDLPIPIAIAGSVDGAKLTEHTGMLLCCVKIVDSELLKVLEVARKNDIFGDCEEEDIGTLPEYVNIQSSTNCILVGWLEGKDNRASNKKIGGPFFEYLESLSEPNVYVSIPDSDLKFKFDISFPMDLKAHQMQLGVGGGSAATDHFCCFCAAQRNSRGLPSLVPCFDCIYSNKPDGYCHHMEFMTSRLRESVIQPHVNEQYLKRNLTFIKSDKMTNQQLYNYLVDIMLEDAATTRKLSKTERQLRVNVLNRDFVINYTSVTTMTDETLNLLFRIKGILDDQAYLDLFISACTFFPELTAMDPFDTESRRKSMRFLTYEGLLIEAVIHRQHHMDDVMIHNTELCVMCTLHMELRIGEYLLTELVRELENFESPSMRNKDMLKVSQFFVSVFAGVPFGMDDYNPDDYTYSFNISMEPNGKTISHIKMSGARQKKVMLRIQELIDIVMSEALNSQDKMVRKKYQWTDIFSQYKLVLATIQSLEDIVDPRQIDAVQIMLDKFCATFREMLGDEKVTNYIHALWSGHCK